MLTVWSSPGAYIRQDALMHTVGSGEAMQGWALLLLSVTG